MTRPLLLVTGIAEGLGAEIAAAFARAGHDVIGLSRGDHCSAAIRQSVEQHGGSYTHLACDLTQASDVPAALAPYGARIDILIHNAHLLLIKPFGQTTAVEFEHIWRVACLGAVLSAQAVIPHMAARKKEPSSSPAPPPAFAGLRISLHLLRQSSPCAGWRNRWRVNSVPAAYMSLISCSTA